MIHRRLGLATAVALAAASYCAVATCAEQQRPSGQIAAPFEQHQPLSIGKVEVLTGKPQCGHRVELRVKAWGTYQSPFDPDEFAVDALVTTPSGQELVVPAFFYQPYERRIHGSLDSHNYEGMVVAGPPQWRVRLTPSQPGVYRVVVRARDRSGDIVSPPHTFTANAADFHGYIRVSRRDPHYFEFDDGTPYFAIGMNLAEGPLPEYYRWLPRLAKNGGNFARIWVGHPTFALELGRIGQYRLDGAWRLDQVVELAEEHGVYLKLCLDWVRFIMPHGDKRPKFDCPDYAYGVANGGPCRDMKDFFTLPEARRRFRNRLRYTVARWGHSPNVMAWELWNEIDCVDRAVGGKQVILPWNQEMGDYLKSIDPWRHLTTNSLGSTSVWDEMWQMPQNHFAQMHGYFYFSPEARENAKDMAGFMLKWLDRVNGFQKPYLFAEYGLVPDVPEVRELKDPDPAGVHLHNGLWAPLAHGAAGTGHIWYWGQYVDPKYLYRHYLPVARFVRDIPWTTAGFRPAEVKSNQRNLRAVGLRGEPLSILWLQNKSHTWWNAAHNTPIATIEGAEIQVMGLADGEYRAEFWDTYEGEITQTVEARSAGGVLRLTLPAISRDLAMKLVLRNPSVGTK